MEEVSTINQRKVTPREAEESFSGLEKSDLAELKSQVGLFTRIAWGCVGTGILIAGIGFGSFLMSGWDAYNEVGDFIGGTAGALWGLAGLFFIYIAFLGQKEQLIYQQAELRETRKDIRQQAEQLEGQKEQLILQNEQAKIQTFENTFFQLLRLHNDIISGIDIESISGRDCFDIFIYRLKTEYEKSYHDLGKDSFGSFTKTLNNEKRDRLSKDHKLDQQEIRDAYQRFYERNQSEVGHYFRNLYHIIKYVNESEVVSDNKGKKFYTSLVRAQLSSSELLLLFYNSLSDYGVEKFKPLIEEYELLENMPIDKLFQPWHKSYYEDSAFGESNFQTS